jgi:hypothetical protein
MRLRLSLVFGHYLRVTDCGSLNIISLEGPMRIIKDRVDNLLTIIPELMTAEELTCFEALPAEDHNLPGADHRTNPAIGLYPQQ